MNAETLLSPRDRKARIEVKREKVLRFLRDETWTHVSVIQALLGFQSVQGAHQTLNKMVRDGLIKKSSIDVAYSRPVVLWGITHTGLAFAWGMDELVEDRPVFQPSKVSPSTMQHKLDLQLLRIKAERAGWHDWCDGSQLGKRGKSQKVPDAVAVNPAGQRFAIEVERTIKSQKRYGEIIIAHLLARKGGQWDKVLYLCPSEDFALRLKRAFFSVKKARHRGEQIELTEQHLRPFCFLGYDQAFV